MSAIATMEALVDCQSQQSQHNLTSPPLTSETADQPLLEHDQSPSKIPVVSKLTIIPTAVVQQTDEAGSSTSSPTSPTSSTSSSFPELNPDGSVSFSFCSPLFYDQKLYVYHILLSLYQRLSKCIEERPYVLLMLQYSIASIHGLTVYVLSVILSIAQLVMITATIENLEWVQSYKPLMWEWDKCFPGFVFPALDIDSDSEDDTLEGSKSLHSAHKDRRYWASRMTLKAGDELVDDGYHSEENQRRMRVKQSMSPTLRRRLVKYQHLVPSYWTPDEGNIANELEEAEGDRPQKAQKERSSAIGRVLPKTLSGALKPSKSKHVTFNEEVQVFGRRRSSQAPHTSSNIPQKSSMSYEIGPNLAVSDTKPAEGPILANDDAKVPATEPPVTKSSPASPSPPPVGRNVVDSLTQDEAEYQRRMASQDVNGSGTSSPLFKAEPRQTTISPAASISSPPHSEVTFPSGPVSPNPVTVDIVDHKHDLKRAGSIPLKLQSLLHRRNGQKGSSRRSATFSEPGTMDPSVPLSELEDPHEEQEQDGSSPRTSLSLGTRARRSLSLVLPRHGHGSHYTGGNNTPTSTGANDSDHLSVDHDGSIGRKNKNLVYRIVHPQRYKRELEQQLSDKDRQRLLAMVRLQHKHLLESDDQDTLAPALSPISSQDAALCGNAYYYATSAEYVEGLGAPNSVISTSIGTSFPEELQPKKSKGRPKIPRPLSIAPAHNTATTHVVGHGSEGDVMGQDGQHPHHKSLFNWRPHSPNRVQHLLWHPGHKHTQSTSSMINPPSASTVAATANDTTCPMSSAITPPISAGAHRLLSLGRSDSDKFTSFTSLGMPFRQQTPPKTPTSGTFAPPATPLLSVHEPTMEHTTFASIGEWSPSHSPAHSAPASPRHSTTIMLSDLANQGHDVAPLQDDSFDYDDSENIYADNAHMGSLPAVHSEVDEVTSKMPRKNFSFMRKLSKKKN